MAVIQKLLTRVVFCLPSLAVAAVPEEPFHLNMHYGVTPTSHDVYGLHMLVFWVCMVIGVVVFSVMGWSLLRHRRSRGVVPATFSGNPKLEIAWTVIPVLILVGIAIPATRTLLTINAHPHPDVIIDVHGSQWHWHYSYAGQGIAFYSNLKTQSRIASNKGTTAAPLGVPYYLRDVDHPLVLPVGKDIRLRITSEDVIHSWWMPDLGFKRDAIPGFINEVDIVIDKPGVYRGQCAELCGYGHAFMPIVVKAVQPEEFQDWVKKTAQAPPTTVQAAKPAAPAGTAEKAIAATPAQQAKAPEKEAAAPWTRQLAMSKGAEIFNSVCAACHQPTGKGVPGVFPALDGSKVVNGPLPAHIKFVVHGSPRNPVMRAFGKEMDNRQLAAVLTYERNSWSNHTGDLVTPQEVEEAR